MSKFCTNCGKEVSENTAFCVHCGAPLPAEQPQPAAQPAQPTYQQPTYQQPTYQQPAYQQPVQPAQQAAPATDKKPIVSIILGIIGIVSAWLFALVGHLTSITGIVFGAIELKKTGKATGLILSIIGEVCAITSSIIGVLMVACATSYYYY